MAFLTVRQIEGRLLQLTDGQIDEVNARAIVDDCYRELYSTWSWSFAKTDGVITTIAPKSSGTVTTTSGGTTLTGESTSWSTTDDVNSFIKVGGNTYEVTAVASSVSVTIDPAYISSGASNLTYTLFKNRYTLATNVEYVTTMYSSWPMFERSQFEINILDPRRDSSGVPLFYMYRGFNTSNAQKIELFPYPDAAYIIRYTGFAYDEIGTSGSKIIILLNNVVLKMAAEMACMTVAAKKDDPTQSQKWMALAQGYGAQWRELVVQLEQQDLSMRGDHAQVGSRLGRGIVSSDFSARHDLFPIR